VDVVAEQATHVVDAQGGHFTTVSAAIAAAGPGDRILVRPGLYEESLRIDKPLEIVGDGPRAQIEIRALDASVLYSTTPTGWVANLTFTQGKNSEFYGATIRQGRLVIEECEILSQAGSCVYIHTEGDPVLRKNTIYGAPEHGVFVYGGGRGTIEENDISGCGMACVATREGGDPVVRRNVIRDSGRSGVYVHTDGRGTFEDNEITGSRHAGVLVETGGNATFRRNRINHNAWHGVSIHKGGSGTFEDNNLAGNSLGPWYFESGTLPHVTRLRNTP
jgi:parallel beta-helix repeat protein